MFYAIVAVLIVIVDQWVKYWVAAKIPMDSLGYHLVDGVVRLVNVHNEGCAFGFLSGANARMLFIILTAAFAVAVIVLIATKTVKKPFGRWCLVLMLAGAVGNCIDRIIYSYVQDMFQLEFWKNFAVFNVADIFLTLGAFLFILYIIFGGEKSDDDDDEDDDYDDDDDDDDYDDDDDDDDDDDYDDEPKRRLIRQKKPEKPSPKSGYEEEYEAYKAKKAARTQKAAPETVNVTLGSNEDPFAEWEKANARMEAQRRNPVPEVKTFSERSSERPVVQFKAPPAYVPAERAYSQSAAKPAAPAPKPAAPAPAPVAPAPAAKPEPAAEWSLDDILNEFK